MQPRLEVLNLNMFLKAGAFPAFLKNYEKLKYDDMIMVERSWNCSFCSCFWGVPLCPQRIRGHRVSIGSFQGRFRHGLGEVLEQLLGSSGRVVGWPTSNGWKI